MKLQLFKGSTEHGLSPNWLGVQTRMSRFKVCTNINEGIVFKVFCWLCCLSKWGVRPFKRGSHLSVQGQHSWSGEPHCSSYREKLEEIQCIMALIWSRWTVYCQLLTLSVLYIQKVSPLHRCDKLDNYYFAICTHGSNCENDRQIQAGGGTWLATEKLSITAWQVFTPWLAENISMKYSPDSE